MKKNSDLKEKSKKKLKLKLKLYLKSIQILFIELIHSIPDILIFKTGADFSINKATLNFVPVLGTVNPFLQPVRVITKPILLITTIREDFSGTFVCDSEGKNGESEEYNDEEEHDEKVNPEKPWDSTESSNDSSDRDEQEEDTENDNWCVEKLLTLAIPLVSKPYSSDYDRDWENKGENVENSNQVVAAPNHFLRVLRRPNREENVEMEMEMEMRTKRFVWCLVIVEVSSLVLFKFLREKKEILLFIVEIERFFREKVLGILIHADMYYLRFDYYLLFYGTINRSF